MYMSHIRCFYCGKDSAVSGFEPSDLDLDIYTRQVRGLGYGGGFEFGPDESVLGDDYYTPKFLDRSIDFIKLLIEKDIISRKEIESRLKIGIPIIDSEDVLPYDKLINMLQNETSKLKNQVSNLKHQDTFSSQNYVTKNSYNKLKKKYADFRKESDLKKFIDDILIDLHNNSDSNIIKGKDDWYLEIYDINSIIHYYLYRELYQMKPYERNMLQERIKTNSIRITIIFNFMRKEPTVTSLNDALLKRPHFFYYMVHGYPLLWNYLAFMLYRNTNRETFLY